MNAATRQKLFDAMMEGAVQASEGNELALSLYTEVLNGDLDRLAPLIDKLLRDCEAELRKPMPCGHPLAERELAPIDEQPTFRAEPAETGVLVLDAKMTVYRCAGCRRHQEFVRRLVEHLKAGFASAVFSEQLDRVLNAETSNIT